MPSTQFRPGVQVDALPVSETGGFIWLWPGAEPPSELVVEAVLPPSGFQVPDVLRYPVLLARCLSRGGKSTAHGSMAPPWLRAAPHWVWCCCVSAVSPGWARAGLALGVGAVLLSRRGSADDTGKITPLSIKPMGLVVAQVHAELQLEVPVDHGLLVENLLDLAHAPFTHTTTFAKGWPVPDVVKFQAQQLLAGHWEPYPIDMSFEPPCMVLSTIGAAPLGMAAQRPAMHAGLQSSAARGLAPEPLAAQVAAAPCTCLTPLITA